MNGLATGVFLFNLVLCTYAAFSCWYKDNLLQHIGISGMAIASAAVLYQVFMYGYLDYNMLAISLGLAVFGLGTFIKHYLKTRRMRAYERQRRKTIKG